MELKRTESTGRRERNKSEKRSRIAAAAARLIAERGISEITTLEIAEAADVASGTVFLYAKTKGELILLAQNSKYSLALAAGKVASDSVIDVLPALLALWSPVIACNREQVENGRAYLREVMFGDPAEVNHQTAVGFMLETEHATREILMRTEKLSESTARSVAQLVSAAALLAMSSPANVTLSVEQVTNQFAAQIRTLLNK